MNIFLILYAQSKTIGDPLLGIIIPGLILLISMMVTWALYKHFSKNDGDKS